MAGEALVSAGPWGLLLLTVSAVLTAFIRGSLVSSSSRDREIERLSAGWEARLAEAVARETDWRAAFGKSEERADLQAEQLAKLMSYAQATDQILRSLPRGAVT